MRKQTPVLEWTIVENDAEWEHRSILIVAENEPVANRRRRLPHYFGRVAALLLLLVAVGGWGRRTTQDRVPQTAGAVTETAPGALRADAQVGKTVIGNLPNDPNATGWWFNEARAYISLSTALQTTKLKSHGDIIVSAVEFGGDRGMAHIVMTAENGVPMHRQTRFYRRSPLGWVQTAPVAALWGAERSLETASFVFHFQQNDALAVMAVVPQVEALYTTLRRNFGLPIAFGGEKLPIDVRVTHLPDAPNQVDAPARLRVSSPALYVAPVELNDADLLAQAIALPLIEQALAQVREHHAIGTSWRPMLHGLYLWQVWDTDLPLADWREAVVTWLYTGLPTTIPAQAVVLPTRYPALCAAHKLWLPAPTAIKIPLICAGLDWEAFFLLPWGRHVPPLRLAQLIVPSRPGEYVDDHRTPHPGDTVALATLIEYAVSTYGRERLPVLIAGLAQYESWETLLPAVYGVSAAEFEAGWQAYLATYSRFVE